MTARSREQIPGLTGIRGFAACWVVAFHFHRLGLMEGVPELFQAFARAGYLGVDLFAILSGFVISLNYADAFARPDRVVTRRYLVARFARIYPLHLAMLLVLALAIWFVPSLSEGGQSRAYQADDFVWNLLLVHGWGLTRTLGWNLPSWTVSAEWLCYLAFPFIALALARVRRGALAAALVPVVIVLAWYALESTGHPRFKAQLGFGLLRIGGEFLAGACLFRAQQLGFGARWPWAALGSVGLGVAIVLASLGGSLGAVLGFAVVVAALARSDGFGRVFGWWPVHALGEISYSIYLVHWVELLIVGHLLAAAGIHLSGGPAMALHSALILGCSVLTYLGVEKPARRVLRARFSGQGSP